MSATRWLRRRAGGLAASLALLVAGCASFDVALRDVAPRAEEDRQCEAWLAALDAAVDAAGVRDAEAARVAGFQQLRVDRFLASFRASAAGEAALAAWLERMRTLDHVARRAEIANLPDAALATMHPGAAASAVERSEACGRQLTQSDLRSPARIAALRAAAAVPDDYVTWQRVLGLYALSRLPFAAGVRSANEETLAAFRAARPLLASAPVRTYRPPQPAASSAAAARIVRTAARDALGVPRFSAEEREQLLAAHAPVLDVEGGGEFDRLGHPAFDAQGRVTVDTARPVVFARVASTRYGEQTLPQLVYTGWFPQRPKDGAFDLLGGVLDGIVWRVTLAPDGEALLYDSMHPCGCYHMFLTTPRAHPRPAPDPDDEWAFIPAQLDAAPARARISVATRTHYLVGAAADDGADSPDRYAIVDEDDLRALPLPGGGTRSLYGPDGLVEGSERLERLLFWPMGIPSAGSMRQWGRHATAFVGRRHFDDADLIERRFRLDLH